MQMVSLEMETFKQEARRLMQLITKRLRQFQLELTLPEPQVAAQDHNYLEDDLQVQLTPTEGTEGPGVQLALDQRNPLIGENSMYRT